MSSSSGSTNGAVSGGGEATVPNGADGPKLFGLVSRGDLKGLKNALCVHEIVNGKVCDLRLINRFGVSLTHAAAFHGQKEILRFLLSSVNECEEVDSSVYEGLTSESASYGSLDNATAGSASGASCLSLQNVKPGSGFINIKSTDQGATPLHFAALGGNKNDIIPYLFSAGADPRIRDFKGLTPQETARAHNHKKTEKVIKKCTARMASAASRANDEKRSGSSE